MPTRRSLARTILATSLVCANASAQPAPSTSAAPAPSASAAPPPAGTSPAPAADQKKDEARVHFDKGIKLFEEEAWDAALVAFVRSRELYATRAATKDAALCLRKLHRFDEALDMFEALLKEFPNLPADDRETAEREMREMAALVGRIELRGGEPGAIVVVDSRSRGTLPLAPIRVPAGTHVVRVVKEGFAPFETQVLVGGAQASPVDVSLAPLMQGGRLKITEQSGKSVNVIIDNAVVGKTPWEGTLPVGDHAVALDGDGDVGTQPASAPVRLNQMTALTLSLEELGARLRVEPTPSVANIAVDGVVVGRGVWEGKVRAGGHRLEVVSIGYLPLTRDVTVTPGKHEVVAVSLERDPNAALTFEEAEVSRQAWLQRGGLELSYELRAQGVFLLMRHLPQKVGGVRVGESPTSGPYVADGTRTSDVFGGGGGGGFGVRLSLMYLVLPDPSKGSTWHSFRVGTGLDAMIGYVNPALPFVVSESSGEPQNRETTTTYSAEKWGAAWLFHVPVTFGYQVGLGSFKGGDWRGMALGLAYAPTLSILKASGFDATRNINLAAFEASVDLLERPMQSSGKNRYAKIFAHVMPPLGGTNPLVIQVGAGAAWY